MHHIILPIDRFNVYIPLVHMSMQQDTLSETVTYFSVTQGPNRPKQHPFHSVSPVITVNMSQVRRCVQ
jgi:hypothetical protein